MATLIELNVDWGTIADSNIILPSRELLIVSAATGLIGNFSSLSSSKSAVIRTVDTPCELQVVSNSIADSIIVMPQRELTVHVSALSCITLITSVSVSAQAVISVFPKIICNLASYSNCASATNVVGASVYSPVAYIVSSSNSHVAIAALQRHNPSSLFSSSSSCKQACFGYPTNPDIILTALSQCKAAYPGLIASYPCSVLASTSISRGALLERVKISPIVLFTSKSNAEAGTILRNKCIFFIMTWQVMWELVLSDTYSVNGYRSSDLTEDWVDAARPAHVYYQEYSSTSVPCTLAIFDLIHGMQQHSWGINSYTEGEGGADGLHPLGGPTTRYRGHQEMPRPWMSSNTPSLFLDKEEERPIQIDLQLSELRPFYRAEFRLSLKAWKFDIPYSGHSPWPLVVHPSNSTTLHIELFSGEVLLFSTEQILGEYDHVELEEELDINTVLTGNLSVVITNVTTTALRADSPHVQVGICNVLFYQQAAEASRVQEDWRQPAFSDFLPPAEPKLDLDDQILPVWDTYMEEPVEPKLEFLNFTVLPLSGTPDYPTVQSLYTRNAAEVLSRPVRAKEFCATYWYTVGENKFKPHFFELYGKRFPVPQSQSLSALLRYGFKLTRQYPRTQLDDIDNTYWTTKILCHWNGARLLRPLSIGLFSEIQFSVQDTWTDREEGKLDMVINKPTAILHGKREDYPNWPENPA